MARSQYAYNDSNYLINYDNEVPIWANSPTYGVNDVVLDRGTQYIALRVNTNSRPSWVNQQPDSVLDGVTVTQARIDTAALDWNIFTPATLGYYRRTSLDDIINNFIVSHVGQDKVLNRVPRHEVAFWGQRAVQEFSYDIFHAQNNIEVTLNPNTLQIPLPQDFVSLVKITYTGYDGTEFPCYAAQTVRAKQAILQDDDYEYNYDQNGELLYSQQSVGVTRWQDPANEFAQRDIARNYYYGAEYDEEYNYYSFYSFQGRRYGTEPRFDNQNGEYVLDLDNGVIYFGSQFAGNAEATVSIQYISDGLVDNGDLTQVYVPKLAEDAIYAYLLYNLSKVRPSAAAGVPLYKKEAMAKMRNAKIRLTDYKLEEITQVMRGKAKWIKH